jgi:hypothetical protein
MRTILVNGDKKFRIKIPDDAELTFGPWSPPTSRESNYTPRDVESRRGTLRVYSAKKTEILAVFAGVTSFRDVSSIEYEEETIRLEGQAVWKSDEHGYRTESAENRKYEWTPDRAELPEGGK